MSIDKYEINQVHTEPLTIEYEDALSEKVEVEPSPDISPVAEEGTPVDPAAPPTDIVNGTDLLNGYTGETDDNL
jgi:hypothetical protein